MVTNLTEREAIVARLITVKMVTALIVRDLIVKMATVRNVRTAVTVLTRQEIGQIVGCSRETVGRILKMLEDQNLISAHGKTIVVYGTR